MYAVEFNTHIENGIVHIPKKYSNLQQVNAKITVMIDDLNKYSNSEILALSNNSANSINEWKDEKEDKIWI